MTSPAFTSSTPLGLCGARAGRALVSPARGTEVRRYAVAAPRRGTAAITMASEKNLEKKQAKVSAVRTALEESLLLFAIPLEGLSVSQRDQLKDKLPEGTSAVCVKNTLMRLAVADTPWQVAESLTKQSSMWVFVREDMKASVKTYKDFMKSEGLEKEIRGGVFEGTLYDTDGVIKLSALPTKKELITKIAIGIKAVPTKIARSIKAVPTKVGRAIKLAVADEDEQSSDQSDAPASE